MLRSSPLRLALLIVLLCAVSLRLLTPPGWMPNLDGRAASPLVICTGAGVQTAPSDPASPGHFGKDGHELCPFAGLALNPPPHDDVVAIRTDSPEATAAFLLADQVGIAPLRRRPQAARAPPLTA